MAHELACTLLVVDNPGLVIATVPGHRWELTITNTAPAAAALVIVVVTVNVIASSSLPSSRRLIMQQDDEEWLQYVYSKTIFTLFYSYRTRNNFAAIQW